MTTAPRFCEECSRELAATARPHAKFCGDRCRQRAHRSARTRLATQVADWLGAQAFTDSEGANKLSDLMSRTASGAPLHVALAASCAAYLPEALEMFGRPTLEAAAIPMPSGYCRTCHAIRLAIVRDEPLPIPDSATAKLLGPTCRRCLPELRAAALSRMPPKARRAAASRRRTPGRSTVATSARHSPQTCRTCEFSAVAAQALTASGAPDAELAEIARRSRTPHERWPVKGARLVSIERRNGQLRTRYTSWSPP